MASVKTSSTNSTNSDHDLLIIIDTKLTALKDSVTALTQSTKDGLDKLNKDKANQDDVDDLKDKVETHSAQIDGIQRKFWIGVGIITAIELLMRVLPNIRWIS